MNSIELNSIKRLQNYKKKFIPHFFHSLRPFSCPQEVPSPRPAPGRPTARRAVRQTVPPRLRTRRHRRKKQSFCIFFLPFEKKMLSLQIQ